MLPKVSVDADDPAAKPLSAPGGDPDPDPDPELARV
jgi:hypothetical protein